MNLISLLENQETLGVSFKNIHPKQVISKISLKVTVYEVKYEYTTGRGNRRKGVKYFLFQTLSPEIDMKYELYKWIKEYNMQNKHRKLLNVKFLNSKCLGYCIIE